MRRSRLNQPGGFVLFTAVMSNLDVDPWCVFCFRGVAAGEVGAYDWLHVSTQRVVCGLCLPDPSAHDGQAGIRMSQRVRSLPSLEEWRRRCGRRGVF